MSFRMFTISSMYQGYLDSYYQKFPEIRQASYVEHLDHLLNETTEFVGSYWRTFRKLGVQSGCFIANDKILIQKWKNENGAFEWKTDEIVFEEIKRYKPDVLWIENLSFTAPEWIDRIRLSASSIKLVAGYHCAPYGTGIMNSLRKTDLVITCTPGIREEMKNQGLKSYLVYHGFDESVLKKINHVDKPEINGLLFSGSLIGGGDFHNDRISLIEKLLTGDVNIKLYVNIEKWHRLKAKQSIHFLNLLIKNMRIKVPYERLSFLKYGKDPVKSYSSRLLAKVNSPVYGIEMYNLLSSFSIILNYHIGVAGDYAGNMRLFEATGVGSCLLTDYKRNLDQLFVADEEVVVYKTPEECIEKAKWLLENEPERKRIALNGQKRTLNTHNVEDRCMSVIKILSDNI